MNLASIFQYKLCCVPPALIDEYGMLRKGSKAPLAHKLCVPITHPPPPDVTIIDVSQRLYHIIWPFREYISDFAESIKARLFTIPG